MLLVNLIAIGTKGKILLFKEIPVANQTCNNCQRT